MECTEKQQGDLVSGWTVGVALLTGLVTIIFTVIVFDYLKNELKEFLR
jgi:hypothetical protein